MARLLAHPRNEALARYLRQRAGRLPFVGQNSPKRQGPRWGKRGRSHALVQALDLLGAKLFTRAGHKAQLIELFGKAFRAEQVKRLYLRATSSRAASSPASEVS